MGVENQPAGALHDRIHGSLHHVLRRRRLDLLRAAEERDRRRALLEFERDELASALPRAGEFDGVVAFGSDATLARIANELPFSTRFIPYGTKASAGYITREALVDEREVESIARGAARDLVLYESEGCLSLHALFVERGGAISPARFAEVLAEEIRAAAAAFPPGRGDAVSALRRAEARDLEIFRDEGAQIYADPHTEHLVVLDPSLDAPPAFLPLAVKLHPVEDTSQAAQYFARHGIAVEALAVARPRPDVLSMAAALGVSRVAAFGTLQTPPLRALHGGRPRIAEFVRWVADET